MENNSQPVETTENNQETTTTVEPLTVVQGESTVNKDDSNEKFQIFTDSIENKFTEFEKRISDILAKQNNQTTTVQTTSEATTENPVESNDEHKLDDMGERVRIITGYTSELGDKIDYESTSSELKRLVLSNKFCTDKKSIRELSELSDEQISGCFYFFENYYQSSESNDNQSGSDIFSSGFIQPLKAG